MTDRVENSRRATSLIRDKSEPAKSYKGRPTSCAFVDCPCRPCWNAHDCGYNEPVYSEGKWSGNKWRVRMECATRHNNGCPTDDREPVHLYTSDRGLVCKRCGHRRTVDEAKNAAQVASLQAELGVQ